MEKTCCQVNVVETEDGYRVEVRGDQAKLREARGACCDVTVHAVDGGFDVAYRGEKAALRGWLQKAGALCCRR
ncbi:MAG: hypothetical protein ACM3RP_10670 [Chitinophagales bacterium]